ncbi:MAG: glycosyltransferase family 4 protein [Fibrobacterota bacterium]
MQSGKRIIFVLEKKKGPLCATDRVSLEYAGWFLKKGFSVEKFYKSEMFFYGTKADFLFHPLIIAFRLLRYRRSAGVFCIGSDGAAAAPASVPGLLPPVISINHGSLPRVYEASKKYGSASAACFLTRPLRSILTFSQMLFSKKILCVSRNDEAFLKRKYRFLKNKILYIGNGAAPSDMKTDPDENKTIIFTGSFTWKKGYGCLEELIASFPLNKFRWEITGTGVPDKLLITKHPRLNRKDVIITRELSHAKLMRKFAEGMCLVQTSLFEGSPLVLYEAMAAGLPQIIFDYENGFSDTIDNETGFIIQTGNIKKMAEALERLSGSAELRKRMTANSLRQSRHFTWEKRCENLKEVLPDLGYAQ